MWFRDYSEEMEEMPFRQSVVEYVGKRFDYYRDYRRSGRLLATALAIRIIKKYLNKSFNKAYSEYCSKVSPQYRYIFLDYFGNFESNPNVYYRYYIDDQYVIKKNKELSPWEKRSKASKVPSKIKKTKNFKRLMLEASKNSKGSSIALKESLDIRFKEDIKEHNIRVKQQIDLQNIKNNSL